MLANNPYDLVVCFLPADFCWMCCGDWKNHGSEYYECSRYKSNPNIVNESAGIQAREALKKYLFYFERVCNTQKLTKKKCWPPIAVRDVWLTAPSQHEEEFKNGGFALKTHQMFPVHS